MAEGFVGFLVGVFLTAFLLIGFVVSFDQSRMIESGCAIYAPDTGKFTKTKDCPWEVKK